MINPLMRNQSASEEQELFLSFIDDPDAQLGSVDQCRQFVDFSNRFYGYVHTKVIDNLVRLAEQLERQLEEAKQLLGAK